MPDNRRILSPQIAPRSSWSAENLPTADQEQKAIIRKFINSAIYVEKTVMPPLRKKSPIEISSLSDSKTRPILTDRTVKRCTCITSPQSCPCHPLMPQIEIAQTENTSETSSTSSSDVGSQITVKSKDHSTENPTDLKLSLCSLHSERTTTTNIDPKEKEEYIKNWLKKKAEQRKKKELEEEKIKMMKEKEKEMIIEKEKQNFKKWLANKKLEEERQKAEKEKKERMRKMKEMEKEQRRTTNQSTYNQWLNRKKRAELEKNIREKLALIEILEEKQRRFETSQKAFENWMRTSKNRPKPVPLNQGLKSLCSSTSVTYINPVPWIPNLEFSQKSLQN